jgi:hypothetical protein
VSVGFWLVLFSKSCAEFFWSVRRERNEKHAVSSLGLQKIPGFCSVIMFLCTGSRFFQRLSAIEEKSQMCLHL